MGEGPPCKERDTFLKLLAKKYSEAPIAGGVTLTGGLVEVLAAPEGGTWSIVVTSPRGITCLVAAGEGWRSLDPKAFDPET